MLMPSTALDFPVPPPTSPPSESVAETRSALPLPELKPDWDIDSAGMPEGCREAAERIRQPHAALAHEEALRLMLWLRLRRAAAKGDGCTVRALLAEHLVEILRAENEQFSSDVIPAFVSTPLIEAVRFGHTEIARLLLNTCKPNTLVDLGRSAFSVVIEWERSELLLDFARLDYPTARNHAWNPLLCAAACGAASSFNALLRIFPAPPIREGGYTLLMFAASGGSEAIVDHALKSGDANALISANLDEPDNDRWAAITFAVEGAHISTVKQLLPHTDLSLRPSEFAPTVGAHALSVALARRHYEVAELLLTAMGRQDQIDASAKEAFALARQGDLRGLEMVLPYVEVNMAEPERNDNLGNLLSPNKSASSLLACAAENGRMDLVDHLLLHAADAELADKNGNTPLACAAAGGHLAVVERLSLVLSGPRCDPLRFNALTQAIDQNRPAVVEFLAPLCDRSRRTDGGLTALMFAASCGRPECIEALLPYSDAKARDWQGATALMFSVRGPAANRVESNITSSARARCVELLLPHSDVEARADPTAARAFSGRSAVACALRKDWPGYPSRPPAVDLLLARASAQCIDEDFNAAVRGVVLASSAQNSNTGAGPLDELARLTTLASDKAILRGCEPLLNGVRRTYWSHWLPRALVARWEQIQLGLASGLVAETQPEPRPAPPPPRRKGMRL
jgi:ankyrin repeat protein